MIIYCNTIFYLQNLTTTNRPKHNKSARPGLFKPNFFFLLFIFKQVINFFFLFINIIYHPCRTNNRAESGK
ncbi:hypothetical protein BWD09_06630 [Neisseria dentiae]|uniref:Uncharacterized protein n=1 Tax=Neisseria dentiae TaxID=194197 RepID=A0A1X3DB04_9NEIS|nr:hypothetical protein BWD09_06630 [Neisseria dentiae]